MRAGDEPGLERLDSEERINTTYSMPLKIYQRRDIEISTEEAYPDDKRRSPTGFDPRDMSNTTTIAKDNSFRAQSRDEETGSERSAVGVVKVFHGV